MIDMTDLPEVPETEWPNMTPRQEQVLRYVNTFKKEKGHSPSVDDIVAQTSMTSVSEAVDYLSILQKMLDSSKDPE